ncbi:hypothetical protein F4805DRAFT_460611 [Annulohypoxylon moriforme]|nr:hypothetical protein F4805DRAFT_460611 [Annulohypoxylon moriforme]
MDVEIGSGSPAIALSTYQQANPRAMYLPANTAAAAAAGISLPPASISNYPNSNSNASHYYYSNSHFPPQPQQYQQHNQHYTLDVGGGMRKMRKRKAETQDNERLSKRLSLLNLEQNGQKLYVPVESPKLRPTECALTQIPEDDTMQLDDSKHKVYIKNLDDYLSDSESDSESHMIFIPDIEKHLLQNRIPPSVLANKDGELAGMQMVLYSEPSSLTVPKEQDSVRKAIIEARQRIREKQKEEHGQETTSASIPSNTTLNGFANHSGETSYSNDPDAMEVD